MIIKNMWFLKNLQTSKVNELTSSIYHQRREVDLCEHGEHSKSNLDHQHGNDGLVPD
jgi:hypothetical protein